MLARTALPQMPGRSPAVAVRWLNVTDFRCYTQARLNLDVLRRVLARVPAARAKTG